MSEQIKKEPLKDEIDEILPTPEVNKSEPSITADVESIEDIVQVLPRSKGTKPIEKLTNEELFSQLQIIDTSIKEWKIGETKRDLTVQEWKTAKDIREVLTREIRKRHLK